MLHSCIFPKKQLACRYAFVYSPVGLVNDNGETTSNNKHLPHYDSDVETEYVQCAFSVIWQRVEHAACTGV